MYEVSYATTRLAHVRAHDRESAKRRFAAYVLYDEIEHVEADVALSFGDGAELAPALGPAPTAGTRAELRAWLARRDEASEAFEPSLYEDPERNVDAYLRLLATNDPWRLEGHGSLGRPLSAIPVYAILTTFDRRITYRFDATQYFDYLRLDNVTSLDPLLPHESVAVESLVDVSALRDEALRQIASSYVAIVRERRLTARYCADEASAQPFGVRIEPDEWRRYVEHRLAQPQRFMPPPGWISAFETYGDAG
jgi:hypothetical protein